eukprot:31315-Pelagococcus_subviridis.AAC.4
MSFSLTPPTGSTSPRSDTSPVIAVSDRAGRSLNSDTSAVHIVTPADGPSFGIAPCGRWTWTLRPRRRPSPARWVLIVAEDSALPPAPCCDASNAAAAAAAAASASFSDAAYTSPGEARPRPPFPPAAPSSKNSRAPPPPPPPPGARNRNACACDCTQLIAMSALSLITSPSCPVSCKVPPPGMTAASMYIKSPPTAVHDNPATTPGMSPW